MKRMDERISESVLRWFGRVKKIGNDRITKRGVCEEMWM